MEKLAPHPALCVQSRSSVLTETVKRLEEGPIEVKVALDAAIVLANFIEVPPEIEVSLFWKCVSGALTVSETLEAAGDDYKTELQCIYNKLAEVLAEAVFIRPEDVSLKRCIEEVGPQAAAMTSRKICNDLLVRLVSSVCVVAKYERKTASESFNRNVVALAKSIIQLQFPDEGLGKVISNSLSSSVEEFSSLLPLILLTAINELALNSTVVIGVFVPVIEFASNLAVTVDKREVLDSLCWQILKKIIAKREEIIEDQLTQGRFIRAVTEFLANQRAIAIETQLHYLLPFCVANNCELTVLALLKSFLNAGRAEFILKRLLENEDGSTGKWLVTLIDIWLKKNFSLTTPSFPSIWKFLLAKCFDSENSLCYRTALCCLNNFLSGLQAFGNRETILPSVRADFSSLCLETVGLFSSSEFVDASSSAKETAIPALDCIASATVILALGETELEEFKDASKKMRKLLKKYLTKCANFADNSSDKEHVLNALVTMCQIEPENEKHVAKLESFLSSKMVKKAFNVTSAVNFYLKHCSLQNMQTDNALLVSLVDTWLSGSPENDCNGQVLILAVRLLDERKCLDSYLNSPKRGAIIDLLSSPQCLLFLTSLPHQVRSQLLELSLTKLQNLTEETKDSNCPIDLIGHILQREADFAAFGVFEKCNLVTFMEMLERHVDCNRQAVAKLSRLACNSVLNDEKLLSLLVSKFLVKRLSASKASLTACQCLLCFFRKIRTLHYKEPFQKLIASLDEEKFSLSRDKLAVEDKLFALTVCLVSLLDWPKFGRDKITVEDISAICKAVPRFEDEFERNLWSNPLIEVLSKCLKSNSTYEELQKAADILLSNVFGSFDLASSAFITVWQNIFKLAGKDAGRLLRHVLFVNCDELKKNHLNAKFGPFCSGYLKALIVSCDNENHTEEEHENAVWFEKESTCPASEMVLALYEGVLAYPLIAIHCLPVVSQFGFFHAHTRGLLSFDLLLAILVSAARFSFYLAQSTDHYTSYCSLLSSLLRLRSVQQENSDSNRLSNILHILLFCLSTAFTTLLEFSLPKDSTAIYFQELSKLIAISSHRRRLLGDAAVHVVGSTFVAAVRSPLPAGFAGLPPVFRKQLISVVVQLFQMCSERALKSMALFLPQECLPLLKSVRSESFVQRKARRKV